MNAVPFDPFVELTRLVTDVAQPRSGSRSVPVDLFREGDRYVLSADLPGADPGSIDIDLDGHLLTIRAERTADSHDGVKWIAHERRGGSYWRQFTLGDGIDTEHISASYDNGVLSLIIPVSERAKPRKIEIAGADTPASLSM